MKRHHDDVLAIRMKVVSRVTIISYSPFAQDPKFRRGGQPGIVKDGEWIYKYEKIIKKKANPRTSISSLDCTP